MMLELNKTSKKPFLSALIFNYLRIGLHAVNLAFISFFDKIIPIKGLTRSKARLKSISILLLTSFLIIGCSRSNKTINGSFEQLDNKHRPLYWAIAKTNEINKEYHLALDSSSAQDGKYSVSITSKTADADFGVLGQSVSKTFSGSEIELRGYLKLQDVSGFAGLWLRIDGAGGPLALENMQEINLAGTRNWKQYSIKLPYDSGQATRINFGGLLAGKGKVWIDNLSLYIDGVPVDKLKARMDIVKDPKTAQIEPFLLKTAFPDSVKLDKQKINNLALLCQIWGFLKYHHPAVSKGRYNMDAKLCEILPSIISCRDNAAFSEVVEKWLTKFGEPEVCLSCQFDTLNRIAQKPNYGNIFNANILKPSLVSKLKNIFDNRNHEVAFGSKSRQDDYYVKPTPHIGNVKFDNESGYDQMKYPNVAFRLLCLFRYWNMIQYFYPNKHLIGRDWNTVLTEFIPRFVKATNETEYVLTTLALIGEIHDSHANIWSYNAAIENYRGRNKLPFKAKFIGNNLVVEGYLKNSLGVKEHIGIGDIITRIDKISVDSLIRKYLPVTPGSNYSAQLRDMPQYYLLRSKHETADVEILHNKTRRTIILNTVDIKIAVNNDQNSIVTPYKVLYGNIGYIYAGKYKNSDLEKIKSLFKNTKGIIIDMRCYPSDFMPFTLVPFIKHGALPFAKATYPIVHTPGYFVFGNPIIIQGDNTYKGKVVVLVNEETQSQAEYTVMAFQSSPNVIVVGSSTAGADGDVAAIKLPGGIETSISGIGILYPDGTETQRVGVKINYQVKPNLDDIKNGRDKLLEKAIFLLNH